MLPAMAEGEAFGPAVTLLLRTAQRAKPILAPADLLRAPVAAAPS